MQDWSHKIPEARKIEVQAMMEDMGFEKEWIVKALEKAEAGGHETIEEFVDQIAQAGREKDGRNSRTIKMVIQCQAKGVTNFSVLRACSMLCSLFHHCLMLLQLLWMKKCETGKNRYYTWS